MGTVGLSFGSPTSGTGFDVSATVSAIVGNLKNVETPWKTQLTALQSQDTAISSLGTLMSKLSSDMSSLTNLTGIMAQKTGSSSDTNVLQLTAASSSATAGTHTVVVNSLATTSSGYLTPITNASDTLSGSITLQVGSGKPQTITLNSSSNTLAGLAAAINASGVGITASKLTDSSGSRLSLVSGTSGAKGLITISANSIIDTSKSNAALDYTASPVVPADAQITVDGNSLTSASNTVTDLIPGLTFQLLSPSAKESDGSLETVQVVIGNDVTDVESTINTMVSDYNSLISAVKTQEGLDSSGNAEPLFGSPTLSLLQQQLMGALNTQNPNGSLDSITTNSNTVLSGSISIQAAGGAIQNFVVGPVPSTGPAANTYYTGTDNNSLDALAAAINAATGPVALGYSGTAGSDTVPSSGALVATSSNPVSGSLSVQVGSGKAQNIVIGAVPGTGAAANTIYTGNAAGYNTLSGVAAAINAGSALGFTAAVTTTDGIQTLTLTSGTAGSDGTLTVTPSLQVAGTGFTAAVVTSGTASSLSLFSQTAGSGGALSVSSNLSATSDARLIYSGTAGSSTQVSLGALTSVADPGDTLSGSISIQVGGGAAQTVTLNSSNNTLAGLRDAINSSNLGVTASIGTDSSGLSNLVLESGTAGSAGTLTVNSSILDTTNTTTAALNYSNSSDLSTLANLGITASATADGTLSFDATTLTSALNSDFSGVVGFFQNANSWGRHFSTMLNNSGNSSSSGVLSLVNRSNSSTESTLNADISREESMISAQQKSLTAELISANEILQQLPSQLDGINQIYSAITGYNSNKG